MKLSGDPGQVNWHDGFTRAAIGRDAAVAAPHDQFMDQLPIHPRKVLFVCSRNRRRSLTAERLLAGVPGYEARSAGTQPAARIVLNAGHIGWADVIVFMEKSHLHRAREKHAEALVDKECVVLHIPDDYEFMQPELMALLRSTLAERFGLF